MKGTVYFVSLEMSVVLSDEYDVTVNIRGINWYHGISDYR